MCFRGLQILRIDRFARKIVISLNDDRLIAFGDDHTVPDRTSHYVRYSVSVELLYVHTEDKDHLSLTGTDPLLKIFSCRRLG